MSWYRDPQLFIHGTSDPMLVVFRVKKEFGTIPIVQSDFTNGEALNFSKHLSLDNNKESDYDAFKATFPTSGIEKMINCQGMVIHWDYPNKSGTWSHEDYNSPFWSLPRPNSVARQDLGEKVSSLEAKISSLEDKVNRTKAEKETLHKRVLDLEAENASLKSQVNRDRDEIKLAGLKREEIRAGLEALEKQVTDLTSSLVV